MKEFMTILLILGIIITIGCGFFHKESEYQTLIELALDKGYLKLIKERRQKRW